MFYAGSGSISAPYTLHFNPSPQLNTPMTNYINYLNSLNTAITGITIDWGLYEGTNLISGPVSTTWTPAGPQPFPSFFGGFPMQVGKWYTVRAVIHLNKGQSFFPEKCALVQMDVRIQVIGARMRDGAAPPAVLEFDDGTTKPVKGGPATPATLERLRR
jgi:hypothetical protein